MAIAKLTACAARPDVSRTDLPSASYELCTLVLADEHLADLTPDYREAARLIISGGHFILIGYHLGSLWLKRDP